MYQTGNFQVVKQNNQRLMTYRNNQVQRTLSFTLRGDIPEKRMQQVQKLESHTISTNCLN